MHMAHQLHYDRWIGSNQQTNSGSPVAVIQRPMRQSLYSEISIGTVYEIAFVDFILLLSVGSYTVPNQPASVRADPAKHNQNSF